MTTSHRPSGARPDVELYPNVPPSVELETEGKRRLVAAVKAVLARLQERGETTAGTDYNALLGSTALLQEFIRAFRRQPDIAADLVLDAKGRPVSSENAALVCGLSLAQICQMLVFTCAKRLFNEADGKTNAAAGERKLNALKPYLAFEWQLPLVKFYYFMFDRQFIEELGREILLLRTPQALEQANTFKVAQLRSARRIVGEEFGRMFAANPTAVVGAAYWNSAKHAVFREVMGDRLWTFYGRDLEYFDVVHDIDRERLEVYGPLLAILSQEALDALQRFAVDKLGIFLAEFMRVFGPAAGEQLLADASFSKQMLKPIVQKFAALDVERDVFAETANLKCTAMRSSVMTYLDRRRAEGAEPVHKA